MTEQQEMAIDATRDSGILLVARDTAPDKLACAIATMILKPKFNRQLVLRTAGVHANYIATRGMVGANGKLAARGRRLLITPTYDVVPGKDTTGEFDVIVYHLTVTPTTALPIDA